MTRTASEPLLRQLSELCAERLGLGFSPERWDDLDRGVRAAANDLGFPDPDPFIRSILSRPPSREELDSLASHMTVGETYFLRDRVAFEALEAHVLPELIGRRAKSDRLIRIWSAGCSTGEEAYSIAIAVRRAIGRLRDWNVTILATDVNPRSLRKASRARYGEWSFRGCPEWLKGTYFRRTSDGLHQVLPEIREMVSLAYLNLAQDAYPSLETGTNAMDIVFCRNVLMYFAPEHGERVVGNLFRALREGGWMFVSPTEAAHTLFHRFARVVIDQAILYRKDGAGSEPGPFALPLGEGTRARNAWTSGQSLPLTSESAPSLAAEPQRPIEWPPRLRHGDEPAAPFAEPAGSGAGSPVESPVSAAVLARELANQGRLAEARGWCEKAVAADRLSPALHYLLATVLQELGDVEEAAVSLRRALYLDPGFVLAYLGLGSLARKRGRPKEALRHLRNAGSILSTLPDEEVVADSGGMTVRRLRETVDAALTCEEPT